MAKPQRFTETDQFALRTTGWRVTPSSADRAWRGEFVATIRATGSWAVVEKGQTVAIGNGENAVACALAAIQATADLKARRLLGEMA